MIIRPVLVLLSLCVVSIALAQNAPLGFEDEQKQQRFENLLEEIRCLVCQNQSLADSPANLARDLRREVHTMIDEGKSNKAITDFLTARYGDFILYRPPLKKTTWLLWFGPFILLIIALAALAVFVRRSRQQSDEELSSAERERAARLLEDGESND